MARWKKVKHTPDGPSPFTPEGREALKQLRLAEQADLRAQRAAVEAAQHRAQALISGAVSPGAVSPGALPPGPDSKSRPPAKKPAGKSATAPAKPVATGPAPVRQSGHPAGAAPASPSTGPAELEELTTREMTARTRQLMNAPAEVPAERKRRPVGFDALVMEVSSLESIAGLGHQEDGSDGPSSASLEVADRLTEKRRLAKERAAQRMAEHRGTAMDVLLQDEALRAIIRLNWSQADARMRVCRPGVLPAYAFMPLEASGLSPEACFVRVNAPWRPDPGRIEDHLANSRDRPAPRELLAKTSPEDLALARHALAGGVVLVWADGPPEQPVVSSRTDDLHRWVWGLAIDRRNELAGVIRALLALEKEAAAAQKAEQAAREARAQLAAPAPGAGAAGGGLLGLGEA